MLVFKSPDAKVWLARLSFILVQSGEAIDKDILAVLVESLGSEKCMQDFLALFNVDDPVFNIITRLHLAKGMMERLALCLGESLIENTLRHRNVLGNLARKRVLRVNLKWILYAQMVGRGLEWEEERRKAKGWQGESLGIEIGNGNPKINSKNQKSKIKNQKSKIKNQFSDWMVEV